jgi:intergrase/recombinase
VNWRAFRKWLEENFSHSYAKDTFNYSKKYCEVLLSRDASVLFRLSGSLRKTVMASLSNLSKFLGVYKEWNGLVENYGLKWSEGKAEDLLVSRMANCEKNGDVLEWVRTVKAKIPNLSCFVDFMLVNGLRFREALASYNLIVNLAREDRLSEYYNEEREALEHFRFKKLFIRRSKKAFMSLIPRGLVEKVSKQERLTEAQINNWVRRDNKLKSRFGDIREYYATHMTRWLNPAEIDFLQGRISSSVFMRNYFNPALIGDLKARAFQGISEIQKRIS